MQVLREKEVDKTIKRLLPREERFCKGLKNSNNLEQAAIRAGYSKKGARATAVRLVSKQRIRQRIDELREEQRRQWNKD